MSKLKQKRIQIYVYSRPNNLAGKFWNSKNIQIYIFPAKINWQDEEVMNLSLMK